LDKNGSIFSVPDAIELTDVALRVIGAFYAFAGFVGTRAGLTSHFLDRAIAAIALKKTSSRENAQTIWLIVAAGIVFVSGVLLLAGLEAAVWAFALSALSQAAYIYYVAPRYFDVEDPPDPQGRRQTTNAFVIYTAATAFVVWAAWRGRLTPFANASQTELIAVAGAMLLYGGYIVQSLWGTPRAKSGNGFGAFSDDNDFESRLDLPPHETKRIKVMADYQCDPLWALDEDRYGCFSPDMIEMSPELNADFKAWAADYDTSFNPDDFTNGNWTDEQYARHDAEGRRLAERLKRERPELMIYVMEPEIGVVEIHADEAI